MTHTEYHPIVFTKDTQKNLYAGALANNNEHILGINSQAIAKRGWLIQAIEVNGQAGVNWRQHDVDPEAATPTRYRYELHFAAVYKGDREPGGSDLKAIVKNMNSRATHPRGGRWALSTVDGAEHTMSDDGERVTTKDFVAYSDIDVPEDFEDHFTHLYGLDSHVARIRGAIEAAMMSDFRNRYHVALIGPPGCGKSDICQSLKRALGDDAVMEYDATATTAAGAIKDLDEREILPRIMVIEEIEKADEKALAFLLALCDTRGEIRKTTARKSIEKDTKLLVVATVNNHELFDKLQAGALSSRFANKLWFKRPSIEMRKRILAREIAKVGGDMAWIDPVIQYAEEKHIDDPRMLSALCLCGRDGWLDGTFYKQLAETDKPQDY